jgi:hypothetical protein
MICSGPNRFLHSLSPNPVLSKGETREILIYLFSPMNHITIKAKEASANQSDESQNSI